MPAGRRGVGLGWRLTGAEPVEVDEVACEEDVAGRPVSTSTELVLSISTLPLPIPRVGLAFSLAITSMVSPVISLMALAISAWPTA